jgi:hypothetical protein
MRKDMTSGCHNMQCLCVSTGDAYIPRCGDVCQGPFCHQQRCHFVGVGRQLCFLVGQRAAACRLPWDLEGTGQPGCAGCMHACVLGTGSTAPSYPVTSSGHWIRTVRPGQRLCRWLASLEAGTVCHVRCWVYFSKVCMPVRLDARHWVLPACMVFVDSHSAPSLLQAVVVGL